jgi:hypothetical protein
VLYVFRHFPSERAHPGAELMSIGSEAAGRQGRFWDMHDALYSREPPIDESVLHEIAASLGLDTERFQRDLHAVADDILSIVILALFHPHTLDPTWLIAGAAAQHRRLPTRSRGMSDVARNLAATAP